MNNTAELKTINNKCPICYSDMHTAEWDNPDIVDVACADGCFRYLAIYDRQTLLSMQIDMDDKVYTNKTNPEIFYDNDNRLLVKELFYNKIKNLKGKK